MIHRRNLLGIDAAGATVVAIVAAVVYFGGVVPARSAAQAAAKEREELSAKQDDLARVESSLQAARQNLDQMTNSETPENRTARTPLDRIRRIGELATVAGVTLTEVSPGAEQVGQRFNRSPLRLKGSGRSPGFISLLREVHREFPDTQVVNLTVTGAPQLRQADQSFEAELIWYTVARTGAVGSDWADGAAKGSTSSPAKR